MRRALLGVLLLFAFAGCGGSGDSGEDVAKHVTLTLDWTPNPDHVGFYYARDTGIFRKAGLDVAIHAPSDPSAPLKLVAAGRSDLAVSYEQEVFFAGEKKLPVVAVAAVVAQPLNSFMSIDPALKSLADLKGHSVGITGVPADYAALEAAGLRRDVRVVNVGYSLLPALLSHKVDAVLGVYRNVEGIELEQRGYTPTVIPLDRAGVPPYDELVLVASSDRLRSSPAYRDMVERFVSTFLQGTDDARANPDRSLEILDKVTASKHSFLAASTPATLSLLGNGCLSESAWERFGAWMHDRGLLEEKVPASRVMTTRYLGSHCEQ
jgi:putative hydroxymethylpyrimidine transport system substrate-binding protein